MSTIEARNKKHADHVAASKARKRGMTLKPGAIIALRYMHWALQYIAVNQEYGRCADCTRAREDMCKHTIRRAWKEIKEGRMRG